MPKCAACHTSYNDPKELELMRNAEGNWVTICHKCKDKGVDVAKVQPVAAVEEAAVKAADQVASDGYAGMVANYNEFTSDNLDNLEKLLNTLRSMRLKTEKSTRARSHERHNIEMTVRFTLARDDTPHDGVVRDLSASGLKMITSKPLTKGQIMQLDWVNPLPTSVARMMQSAAEVRRVNQLEGGAYEVGIRFVKRQLAKEVNRRKFRRYKCEMDVFYQREQSEMMSFGKVKDISQGGSQIFAYEVLEVGELLTVRLVGGAGNRGDLIGALKVRRVILRGAEYEIGCSFVQMKMSQHLAKEKENKS